MVEVDECVGGPEDTAEVFAADELAGMLEEIDKPPEGLLADSDGNAVAPQFEIARIDFKDTENARPARYSAGLSEAITPTKVPLGGV